MTEDDRGRGSHPPPSSPAPSSRRRSLSAHTLPEVPLAKKASNRPPPMPADEATEIAVGSVAPDFTLANQAGFELPLSSLRGGSVALVFFPEHPSGDFADLARALADARRQLVACSAVAVLVTRLSPELLRLVAANYKQELVMLADPHGEVHRRYGAADPGTDETQALTLLIDAGGTVRAAWRNLAAQSQASTLLQALAST